ncbi:hypothetical protein BT96DRAFT_681799 [Gymnopus androsaceus JB14]|uniref:Uncharacterized protein n=1 Tax=Gymnopus androsaceus JB14 TaxID=1447944 RepID=A0A6A4HS48_9AGAR|nr:hypothetical protein BT96DRAFT_681799 [Gymnopus androsaceus JB14]
MNIVHQRQDFFDDLKRLYFDNASGVESFVSKDTSNVRIAVTAATISEGVRRLDTALSEVLSREESVRPDDLSTCVFISRRALLTLNPFPSERTLYTCISSPNIVTGETLEDACRSVVFGTKDALANDEPILALPQGSFSDVINTPIKRRVEDGTEAGSRKKPSATTTNTAARTRPWARRIVGPLVYKKVFPLYRPRRRIRPVSVTEEPTIVPQITWYLSDCKSDDCHNDTELYVPLVDASPPRLAGVPDILISTLLPSS